MLLTSRNYTEATRQLLKATASLQARASKYEAYFETLRPQDDAEFFRRGLFAFASVHTTWRMNCKLFTYLWDFDKWVGNQVELAARLQASRAGMQNTRCVYLTQYATKFWERPRYWNLLPFETWTEYRQRLERNFKGLGPTKAAFFIELTRFHDSQTVCADTHLLQTYGFKPGGRLNETEYKELEAHWAGVCHAMGVSPVTARWIMWDLKQNKDDSTYWSYVLEMGLPKALTFQMTLEL